MDSRYYPGVEADLPKLIVELRSLFDADYEVQTMHVSSTTVLQARKSSTLRDLTGLSAALTIKITPEAGGTRVEIGLQKWADKAAVAAVALLLSAGLLVALPALGAYWQYKLTEDVGKRSRITSPARPVDMCRLCRGVAATAARQTMLIRNSAPHAAPTWQLRVSVRRVALRKKTTRRDFAIVVGNPLDQYRTALGSPRENHPTNAEDWATSPMAYRSH